MNKTYLFDKGFFKDGQKKKIADDFPYRALVLNHEEVESAILANDTGVVIVKLVYSDAISEVGYYLFLLPEYQVIGYTHAYGVKCMLGERGAQASTIQYNRHYESKPMEARYPYFNPYYELNESRFSKIFTTDQITEGCFYIDKGTLYRLVNKVQRRY